MADLNQQQLQLAAQQMTRTVQDLAKILQQLGTQAGSAGAQTTNMSNALRSGSKGIKQTIDEFEQALNADSIERTRDKVLEEYKKTLEGQSAIRRWFEDNSKQEQAERLKQDTLARKELRDKLENMVNENKQNHVELRKRRKLEADELATAKTALDDAKRLQTLGVGPGQAVIDQLEAEVKAREGALASAKQTIKDTLANQAAGRARIKGLTQEIADGEARLKDAQVGAEGEKLKNSIGSWVTKIDLGAIAMTAFTKAVWDTVGTIHSEMKFATRLNSSIANQIKTATLGLSRAEYAALTGEYRRTMGAMGGLQEATDLLASENNAYYELTGDLKEATEIQLQAYQMLTNNGIKMSTQELKRYSEGVRKSYNDIKFQTGLSLKQFTDTLRELEDDESTRIAMRLAAGEQERRQIMENNQARIKENLAMGMTREQALAAAKAMNKMAGEKPLDRFKKSIKLQMAMGAMGVGGGEEAARIYRKPKNKRTKEEEAYLQERMSAYSNQMSTQMGSEDLGTAAFAEKIGEKSGFTEESLADLNTKGIQPLKASLDNLNETIGDTMGGFMFKLERGIVEIIDYGKSILANVPAIGVIMGGVAAIVALTKLIRGGALFSGIGKAVSKVMGTGGAASAASTAAGGVSQAGQAAAGKAGGAMSSVGKGISSFGKGVGGAIQSTFTGLAKGLERLATPKVGLGILALTGLTIPLWTSGKALQAFSQVSWADVGKGVLTIGALAVTASLLSGASVPMLIGAAAIAALGGAMWVAGKAMQEFAVAFQQFAEVKWDQLSAGLGAFGTGLAQLWDNAPNPVKLIALAGGIAPLGLAMVPLAASIAMIDTNKFGDFVNKLGQLANLDVAKIKAVAAAIKDVNEATNNTPSLGATARAAFAGVVDRFVGQNKDEKKEESKDNRGEQSQLVTTITQQLAKMDKSNEYLKVVAENMPTLVQIANKQLEATMITEKQKEEKETKPSQNSLKGSLGFLGL